MPGWNDWLDERIGALRAGRRVLVLCRTKATLSLVRRWAARRGGVLGLEAATPQGLAQQVRQEPLLARPRERRLEDDALPPETAIGRRVGGRPGLAGVARRWTQHVRLARAVNARITAPAWLDELVDTGFGVDDGAHALESLIAAVARHGRRLSASASWDRVVTIGFDRDPTALAPHEPWLVRALVRRIDIPIDSPAAPLPARRVPDVAAEARLAVVLAAESPDRTLILVNELATARRVRDALTRSALPCAWRDAEALAVHELASAVRRCAPWFADAPDPPIPLADLDFVLSRTALRRTLHPAAEAAIGVFLAISGAEPAALTRSAVRRALERTRLLDGPLSAWRARIREQLADPERAAGAAGVLVRLELLNAALTSRPVEDVLAEATGVPLAFDPDDFDDVVATLLGEEWDGAALAGGTRLGAVQRFLLACRVRLHDDPVARAIVGALRHRAEWPATPSHVHHALAGAVDLGRLSDGVDVITVDDYDGRPCGTLVVLDVHDHGLARRPNPDPLLEDAEIAALGALPGRAQVDERLRQVHRAAARAERVVAVVTRRDANGREVVPPIQLDLRFDDAAPVPSYGWRLPGLPESAPILLASVPADRPPEPVVHPDPVLRHLAHQATAEWYRDGRGPPTFSARPVPDLATLADLRRAEVPLAPAHLLPYLGHAEHVPEAALPPGPHSVSGLLKPLAHCGYQAFGRVVLGVQEKREIADDLDPTEVGRAVHRALELVTPEVRWRAGDVEKSALVDRLRAATRRAFAEAVEDLGLSRARQASADGHRDRWNEHWEHYVDSRSLPPANPGERLLEDYPWVGEWAARLRAAIPSLRTFPERKLRAWLLWAARKAPGDLVSYDPRLLVRDDQWEALPASAVPDLLPVLRSPEWAGLYRQVSELVHRMEIWATPPHATAAEMPFGQTDGLHRGEPVVPAPVGGDVPEGTELVLGPTVLKLGGSELALHGFVDRLDFVLGPRGERYVAVVDYKTGMPKTAWGFRRDQLSLQDPQLAVYAMVVERASREDRLPAPLGKPRVLVLAHDRVRMVVDDPEVHDRKPRATDTWMPVEPKMLAWAASQLGVLVDDARQGRWSLRPRADTCPMVAGWSHDHCPLARACRLRALQTPISEEDPESPGGGPGVTPG